MRPLQFPIHLHVRKCTSYIKLVHQLKYIHVPKELNTELTNKCMYMYVNVDLCRCDQGTLAAHCMYKNKNTNEYDVISGYLASPLTVVLLIAHG